MDRTKLPGPDMPADASAQDLMQVARQQIISRDWSAATTTLDKVKAKEPTREYLWASYGGIALMQGKKDEAKTDFKKGTR